MIMTYFDLSESTIGNLNLSDPIPKGDATGASKDWLVEPTRGTATNNLQTFLLDPISGVQIPLPPLSTITSASGDSNVVLYKIQDASQFVVAASFDEGKILALCRANHIRRARSILNILLER